MGERQRIRRCRAGGLGSWLGREAAVARLLSLVITFSVGRGRGGEGRREKDGDGRRGLGVKEGRILMKVMRFK